MFPHEVVISKRRISGVRFSRYLLSLPAILLIFGAAVAVSLTEQYVIGAVVFALFLCVELVLCSDLSTIAFPLLLLSVFICNCYDSFDTFIRFFWIAPIAVAALVYNIVVFREKLRFGRSFFGLVAVSVALLLAGIGTVSPSDYFTPTSIFYTLGLGVGMAGFYLLARSRFAKQNVYGLFGRISLIMYLVGIFVCVNIFGSLWDVLFAGGYLEKWVLNYYEPSNNMSTFLMLAMPFPVWFALKQNPLHFLSTALFFVAIGVTGSRAGLMLGALEFVICTAFWAQYSGRTIRRFCYIFIAVATLLSLIAVTMFRAANPDYRFVYDAEMRSHAIPVSIQSFLGSPVFGIGLKSHVLDAYYLPKKGALNWFHMYFPQIIASMGSVGIIAYCSQLLLRASLIIRRRCSPLRLTLGLSYLGLFLMSQLNPGEFCPIPYGMMAVAVFALLEQLTETERLASKLAPEWGTEA